jgi:pimeloyl-ACP methyl ester carboxylesterase
MPDIELRGGEVDGLSLHYVVEGRGPVVVLVHGLAGFAESWRRTTAALAARATVFAVDLPGFGHSAKPRARYGLVDLARALHGFMDAMGLPHASLVGHSLGGAVAITYALTHPTRVERLALLGALVPGFEVSPPWAYRLLALPGVGETLGLCGCRPLYRAALRRCFHVACPDDVEFLVNFAYAARSGAEARAAYLATVRHAREDFAGRADDYRRALATLDHPVLVVHGRQDRVVPLAHAAQATAGLKRAEARWVEGCGHFPQIEHADAVNGWLTEFLVARPAPR